MLQLILWVWRVVIIGTKRVRCVRSTPHGHDQPASAICESGLCVFCCESRCRCLDPIVKQTKELQA